MSSGWNIWRVSASADFSACLCLHGTSSLHSLNSSFKSFYGSMTPYSSAGTVGCNRVRYTRIVEARWFPSHSEGLGAIEIKLIFPILVLCIPLISRSPVVVHKSLYDGLIPVSIDCDMDTTVHGSCKCTCTCSARTFANG